MAKKPQIVCANKIDIIDLENETYKKFVKHVESKGIKVFPVSAPINIGIKDLINEVAKTLLITESEPLIDQYEIFDFEKEEYNKDYRKIYCYKEGDIYILAGEQLKKIFNSTNFNDMGSLRYLYKYIEKSGAISELTDMGLKEGDTIRIEDFEFEYIDEF